MKRVWLVGALLCATVSSTAFAQYTTPQTAPYGSEPTSKADIVLLGGYAFTLAQDVYAGLDGGELDINDNAYYGIALDFNVVRNPGKTGQLRLMYRREDSEVTFRSFSLSSNGTMDCAIEYWQIGGLGGIRRGKAMPFTAITLGGTRLSADGGDDWKFSMIFGLGVKVYTSPKFGIMLQANWPITFTDTWGGATVGTGGAGLAIGGTGISQLDIGGGLFMSF
jgi:hypothetical protein